MTKIINELVEEMDSFERIPVKFGEKYILSLIKEAKLWLTPSITIKKMKNRKPKSLI